MEIANWLSAGALVVSLFALFQSWKTSNRQTALQERLAQIEEVRERDRLMAGRRANLTARLERRLTPGYAIADLRISNEGPGTARAIEVFAR